MLITIRKFRDYIESDFDSLLIQIFDRYTPMIEYFSNTVMPMPLSGKNEPKRRFLPSKWEHKKVRTIHFFCLVAC